MTKNAINFVLTMVKCYLLRLEIPHVRHSQYGIKEHIGDVLHLYIMGIYHDISY